MPSPYTADDKGFHDYVNSKNNAGQVIQGGFNTFSDPFSNLFGNNAAANNTKTGTFSNPLGLNFTGGQGGWNQDLANDPEVFKSMTDEDWAAFSKMGSAEQSAWVAKRKKDLPQIAAAASEEAKYQQWRKDTMARLDKFSKEMSMSVPELLASGNLGVQQAQSAGLRAGAGQGLAAGSTGGGISELNSQKAAMDSMNQYATQRQQIGLAATQGLIQFDEGRRQYDQGINLQMQQANMANYNQQYMQHQQQQAGLLGLAGTVVGGIYGGPMGAQAGGQLGQAAGGYMYQQQNPYTPPKYKTPYGSGQGLSNTQQPYYGSQ